MMIVRMVKSLKLINMINILKLFKTKTIVVTERSDDFHACFKGHPETWACGPSKGMAIGNLIKDWGSRYGIKIVHNVED